MDATPRERPRAVTIVGWIWLVAATLRFLNGLLGLLVWKVGGLDRGLPFLAPWSGPLKIRMIGLDIMMRHAAPILALQVLVAAALGYAAFELLRQKAWAKSVVVTASWIGIAVMAGVGACVYASMAQAALESPESANEIRMAGVAAGVFVALLGALFFGGTIFLLRRPDVRRSFEAAAVEPS
jgi:hypothetical protein